MFALKFYKDKRLYAFYLTREAFFDTVIHSFGEKRTQGKRCKQSGGKIVCHSFSIEGGGREYHSGIVNGSLAEGKVSLSDFSLWMCACQR